MSTQQAAGEELRFGFGQNWKSYIETTLGEQRIAASQQHMLEFLGLGDLKGKSFLDIGCGSGLHSLAAFRAGADSILGFDYDPKSVEATMICHRYAGSPTHWSARRGSVLDEPFMNSLPESDIVYSWGVLHHTGDVWSAIRHAAGRVRPGGLFYIALYSADVQKPPFTAQFWLDLKQRYVKGSWLVKRSLEAWYLMVFMLGRNLFNLPALIRRARDYKTQRGMSMMTDIRDWLGGWPMQFVHDAEAVAFCEKLGLKLERIKTGEANTEFLFRRASRQD